MFNPQSSYPFQVPKGMLQTLLTVLLLLVGCWFQVPKGMLQTNTNSWNLSFSRLRVSSPQGNATNKVVTKTEDGDEVVFQVPKGMLQTLRSEVIPCFCAGFKSPRECYKRTEWKWTELWESVSSPQGNATNPVRISSEKEVLPGFKSPRECYKPYTTSEGGLVIV